jgi:hypothetical protein
MSSIPDSKHIVYRNLVASTKDGAAGAPTRNTITGKFSAALDSAQGNEKKDPLKDKKDKILKSEGLISANLTDPANHPLPKPEND